MGTHIEQLRRAIEEENPIAFVGAGVAARAKYPSWSALLDLLAEAATGHTADKLQLVNDDALWRAEQIRQLFPSQRQYREALAKIFSSEGHDPDDCIRDLVRLPFRHFMTTNYDDVLERAHLDCFGTKPKSIEWRQAENLRNFITGVAHRPASRDLAAIARERRYLHIHGRHTDGNTIVLSDSDYTARYLASEVAQRKLFAIFATQVVVFFGFSLTDADFMEILRVVRHSLGGKTGRHYAVLPSRDPATEASTRARLENKFDVRAVFYPQTDDHRGLEDVIHQLHGREARERVESAALRHTRADLRNVKFLLDVLRKEFQVTATPVETMRDVEGRVFLLCSAAALKDPAFIQDAENALARVQREGPAFLTLIALPDVQAVKTPLAKRLAAHGWIDVRKLESKVGALEKAAHAFHAADPNRGQFGETPERNKRRLSARVTVMPDSPDWFRVNLRVQAMRGGKALKETVTFHLHPTFSERVVPVEPKNGVAELERIAWGAFTVGATTDGGRTKLELNLATLKDAPKAFRER